MTVLDSLEAAVARKDVYLVGGDDRDLIALIAVARAAEQFIRVDQPSWNLIEKRMVEALAPLRELT